MVLSPRTWVALLLLALALIVSACQPQPLQQPKTEPDITPVSTDGRLTIHALDVGQGDGLLIISPGGKSILIDAGPVEAGDDVVAALQKYGVNGLDLIVATHPHADHIGGMRRVMQNFPVKRFLDSGQDYSSKTYELMLQEIQWRQINFIKVRRGITVEIDSGAKLDVLNPDQQLLADVGEGRSVINANSIVLRLSYGEFAMLFTGDAEFETEAMMMNAGANLQAQVLKIGHHGSRHATSGKFLDAVKPQAAIISDGATNDYGHPAQPTLDRLRKAKIQTYRTDLQSEITIVSDGKSYEIKPARKALQAQIWFGRQPLVNELVANP